MVRCTYQRITRTRFTVRAASHGSSKAFDPNIERLLSRSRTCNEDDDRAAVRLRWIGLRWSGEHTERRTVDIVRVANGRAVEHWAAAAPDRKNGWSPRFTAFE